MDGWLSAALASARIGGSVLLSLLGNAVLVPVVLFYLLIDWPQLVQRVQGLVPPRARDACAASSASATTCSVTTCAASCW
jgi:predicted PurR-regulated permease PerM